MTKFTHRYRNNTGNPTAGTIARLEPINHSTHPETGKDLDSLLTVIRIDKLKPHHNSSKLNWVIGPVCPAFRPIKPPSVNLYLPLLERISVD